MNSEARRRGIVGLAVVVAIVAIPVTASGIGEAEIAFHSAPEGGRVRITLAGRPVATYVYRDDHISRPYFCDLHAPGGGQVSRHHPPIEGKDPTDHATFHPGAWLAFGDLSGADNWRNRARVEHERFAEGPLGGHGLGTFTVVNRYLAADGAVICRETCRYTIQSRRFGTLLTIASEFTSETGDFSFGDQEEMGLGIRMATDLSVKNGGRLRNSAGQEGERRVWGEPAEWCDSSGEVDGRRIGVLLMSDPRNFRPSWFHARDYGLLVANPFGRAAFGKGEPSRVRVVRGERFRLGFGVLLHEAPAGQSIPLEDAYQDYLVTR